MNGFWVGLIGAILSAVATFVSARAARTARIANGKAALAVAMAKPDASAKPPG